MENLCSEGDVSPFESYCPYVLLSFTYTYHQTNSVKLLEARNPMSCLFSHIYQLCLVGMLGLSLNLNELLSRSFPDMI